MKKEFEAHLTPAANGTEGTARGKAEWKEYQDGSRRLKLSVSGIVPGNGTMMDVIMGDHVIGRIMVERGAARFKRESEQGEQVPTPAAGQLLQIVCVGNIVLEGRFVEE